ncbi:MAG: hypothetical protein ACP5TY_06790, partial [Thermodesulforhabdaceae bacterium]
MNFLNEIWNFCEIIGCVLTAKTTVGTGPVPARTGLRLLPSLRAPEGRVAISRDCFALTPFGL